jgi:hypothetical protein
MSTTNSVIYSIDDLRKAADDLGSHYFEPETMRFFNSRVLEGIYRPSIAESPRCGLFITSERFESDPRRYSIRRFTITHATRSGDGMPVDVIEFDTIGGFQAYGTAETAKRHARKLIESGEWSA